MQISGNLHSQAALAAGGYVHKFHPAAIILTWILLAVAMQIMPVVAMFASGLTVLAVAMKFMPARLLSLLRRTRWIMLTLLLVYGYAVPGAALWAQAGMFSPTQEGLADGATQLSRLVFMLAGLSIVLGLLKRKQLVAGLYTLLYPLRYLGLSRERIAVRLALTLFYAESTMHESVKDWRSNMEQAMAPAPGGRQDIELYVPPITWRDGLLLAAALAVLIPVVL